MSATSNQRTTAAAHAAPTPDAGRWTEWDQRRLDILRTAFVREGWTLVEHGRFSDSYELDLGHEGVAQALIPRDPTARDTNRRARDAADTLILISGRPHLELGPLTEREAAWTRAMTTPVDDGADETVAAAAANPASTGESHVDELARRPWTDVPEPSRYVDEHGERKVLGWGERGTTLAPWAGPTPDTNSTRQRLADHANEASGPGARTTAPPSSVPAQTPLPGLPNTL
jgi:hypothetical protein